MGALRSQRRAGRVDGRSPPRDPLPAPLGDVPVEPTEVLIKEARRRQRRRWGFTALILAMVGGVIAGVLTTSSPRPPRRPVPSPRVLNPRALESDAHGLASCSSLGLSVPYTWGIPTRGAAGIWALTKSRLSVESLSMIGRYSPANCITEFDSGPATAFYFGPRNRARMWVIMQFPTQLTRHDLAVLSRGAVTYLRRTGAFTYVHGTDSRVDCSTNPRSPLCHYGLPLGSSG